MSERSGRTIEWIHPSWRDLLIENLVAHPSERRAFLDHSGVDGILLAMSRAGGFAGSREFPLLIDDDDWKSIAVAITRNLPVASMWEIRQIFAAIIDAIEHAPSALGKDDKRLAGLANACLTTCRGTWDKVGGAISYENLDAYYRLTTLVRPLLPGPQLDASWLGAWNRVKTAVSKLTAGGDDFLLAFEAALDLARLIERNEPRFLIQSDYPGAHVDLATQFLSYADEDLRSEPSLDDESDFDDRDLHLSDMVRLMGVVAQEFTSLSGRFAKLIEKFEAKAQSVHIERREKFGRSRPDDDEPSPPDPLEFDVTTVFEDL